MYSHNANAIDRINILQSMCEMINTMIIMNILNIIPKYFYWSFYIKYNINNHHWWNVIHDVKPWHSSSLTSFFIIFNVTILPILNICWVQMHLNEPMRLLYKRIMSHFLIIFTFSYEGKFEWNLLQLVINNIFAPIYHMFCVFHCWINTKISKRANFVKIYILSWNIIIILDHTKIC
jgi:hypothetical protein